MGFGVNVRRWEPGQRLDWHNVEGGRPLAWYLARGFKVCDGQNGTPNLIDKFVKYQDEANEGSTGGAKTVTPSGNVSVENHTLTESQMPQHRFRTGISYPTAWTYYGYEANTSKNGAGAGGGGQAIPYTEYKGGSQAHNHGGQFSGNSQDNEPQHVCCVPLIYLPGA